MAFGSIAIPIITLAGTTGLPLDRLSAGVGRICAPVSLFIPAYLILVMAGLARAEGRLPAAAVCGVAFAGTQFGVSNFVGAGAHRYPGFAWRPWGAILLLLRGPRISPMPAAARTTADTHRASFMAWAPYVLLVVFVLAVGLQADADHS